MGLIVLSATVCHLTANVARNGDATIARATGKRVWSGAQRFAGNGDYRLVAGDYGNGASPGERVPLAMVEALEKALDAAHDSKFHAEAP